MLLYSKRVYLAYTIAKLLKTVYVVFRPGPVGSSSADCCCSNPIFYLISRLLLAHVTGRALYAQCFVCKVQLESILLLQ